MMEKTAHVLLVDDDTALLQAMPQMLRIRIPGIQIDPCTSGYEALEQLPKNDYDVIISDIKMPGMDGLELLSKIKAIRPGIPVILITGHGEHELAIQALRGGAYDYIQKPIDREGFIAALQRAIQAQQLRKRVIEQQIALTNHTRVLENQMEKRTSELEEANATKEKLLGIVAHEVRQPLANIQGMAHFLQRQLESGASMETISQGLQEIERSLNRTASLLEDMLDTSLSETNMFVLHRTRCDLVELCRHLLQEYTMGAGPTLTSEALVEPLEADVDPSRITQVLLNLLSNARKYSPHGSSITITVQQIGYEAVIAVRDQGVGIPEQEQQYIFEQFYRVPGIEVQTGGKNGAGLGLYISKKIVERHGGQLAVQSSPNEGSTFSIHLPMFVDPEQANVNIDTQPHSKAAWTLTH